MTVESTTSKITYEGNGLATVFPVPFQYSRTEDIRLMLTDADGEETEITTNFRIDVSESSDTSVTFPIVGEAIPHGVRLTVFRSTPQNQIVDLIYGGAFSPDVLEYDGFDRIVMMVQELQEEVDRAIRVAMAGDLTSSELKQEIFDARDTAVSSAATASEDAARAETAASSAELSAGLAKADADRAAALVDPASLASSVFNVRKAFVLQSDVATGNILTLPGYYFPTRDVLFLSYMGTVCTPKLPGVESAGEYQYEEVGTDPNVTSNQVRLHFSASAGDVFDLWVVSSAAGRNVEELEVLVDEARTAATAAQWAEAAAETASHVAEVAAGVAEEAAARIPDPATGTPGQVLTVISDGTENGLEYRNPPGGSVTRQTTVLASAHTGGTAFPVPSFMVGSEKLTLFMDGLLTDRGTGAANGFYQEVGATGAASTTITIFETLPAGTVLTAVAGA